MANANSTTLARPEIVLPESDTHSAIPLLISAPLGNSLDLFDLLDRCRHHADALLESDNHTERMALCGRLLAGLEVLRSVLQAPLPQHLIDRLTTDAATPGNYRCPLATDSETLREYCAALAQLLLQHQQTAQQQESVTGLLSELVSVLVTDLKAPRYVRTEAGLMMIGGEGGKGVH